VSIVGVIFLLGLGFGVFVFLESEGGFLADGGWGFCDSGGLSGLCFGDALGGECPSVFDRSGEGFGRGGK